MPTYYTPPQTPTTTTTTTTSSSSSSSRPSLSRPNSYSHSVRTHTSTGTRSTKPSSSSSSKLDEPRPHGVPFLFLSSIAAASLLAHKYWPKGYPHGDKEDWELSEYALRARERRRAEKAARRDGGEFGGGGGGGGGYFSGSGYGGEGGYRRGGGDRGGCGYGYRARRAWEEEDADAAAYSGRRGGSRDRGLLSSRRVDGMGGGFYERGSAGRERSRSVSSRDSRPQLGRTCSARSVAGSRAWPSDVPPLRYYERRPSEVVYIYRDAPERSRRASFDVGGDGRQGWYYH